MWSEEEADFRGDPVDDAVLRGDPVVRGASGEAMADVCDARVCGRLLGSCWIFRRRAPRWRSPWALMLAGRNVTYLFFLFYFYFFIFC